MLEKRNRVSPFFKEGNFRGKIGWRKKVVSSFGEAEF